MNSTDMDFKKAFILAGVSSILAITACFIYNKVYSGSFYVDFSKIISPTSMIMSCLVGCTMMSLTYALLIKLRPGLKM